MLQLLVLFSALMLSYAGVGGLCSWAKQHQILDTPNPRSSHTKPTPHAGGLAIVLITLGGLFIYSLLVSLEHYRLLLFYAFGGVLVAGVSWLDDLYGLPGRVRFAVHSLAALTAMLGLGHWDEVAVPLLGQVHVGWLGVPATFLWIVGLTNGYNFMDGIDGIAGGQAVVAGIGWAIMGWLTHMPLVTALGALLAATSLGFLFHNWPPARIFMGDVGSAFLGYSFACLAILGTTREPSLATAGVLLVWPFVFDTVFTLFRRLKNRENVFASHRSHLYQRLIISGYSHRTVTSLYMGLDALGVCLAILIVSRNGWVDLIVVTLMVISCVGLWGLTVLREHATARIINSSEAIEEKVV
jgi:UDP-N-acetylmuramyl pentapeptide phosphotransferase/UDP-N-acetylglucosamine-1-phosphate transferase